MRKINWKKENNFLYGSVLLFWLVTLVIIFQNRVSINLSPRATAAANAQDLQQP